jgi:Thioredoxin
MFRSIHHHGGFLMRHFTVLILGLAAIGLLASESDAGCLARMRARREARHGASACGSAASAAYYSQVSACGPGGCSNGGCGQTVQYVVPQQMYQQTLSGPATAPPKAVAAPTPVPAAPVTYAAAREQAAHQNVPVLVVVCKDDCPPCRQMEATIAGMNLQGVSVCEVRAEQEPYLVSAFGVSRFPTVVALERGGSIQRSRAVGAVDAATILAMLPK